MKLLLIPDLHGRKPIIPKEEFDAIVCIGDICSDKGIRVLIKEWVRYIEKNPSDRVSDDAYIIRKVGRKGLNALFRKSLNVGNELLKYLDSFGKPIFFVPGNWDQCYGKTKIKDPDKDFYSSLKAYYDYWLGDKLNPKLIKGVHNLVDCQFKVHEFQGFNFIGYGLSSNTEELKMRKKKSTLAFIQKLFLNRAYKSLITKLGKVYAGRDKDLPTIFLTHNVPYGTKIDVLKNKNSKLNGRHFGSNVAREFILKNKPILCIGGHMHEHFGKIKLGKTTCINVGFGNKKAVIVSLDNGKIRNIKFIGKTNV